MLFVSGAAMGSSLGFGFEAIDSLGLRLLSIDRAGLGLSTTDPSKSFESIVRDVEAVLLGEGIDRLPIVAFSQGAPFAIALAARGLGSALAIVAGQDELAHPRMRPLLVPDVLHLVEAIEADQEGFEITFAERADADGMWALVLGMSAPIDRALYEDEVFANAYRRCLAEGFSEGSRGYVRDLALAMSRWPMAPETVALPTTLWYGRLDTSPVHSPDFGATLAARFPNAVLRVLPDEGGSLLWTRGDDVLRDLLARCGQSRG